jgi:hypothetical protein
VQFIELCRLMGLLTQTSVAIDGSKFKAVNTRDKNFTRQGLLGVHSRCGLHTRAVTMRDTLIEGFSHFVSSVTAPIASGWSGCRTHWKAAHTRHGHRPAPRLLLEATPPIGKTRLICRIARR